MGKYVNAPNEADNKDKRKLALKLGAKECTKPEALEAVLSEDKAVLVWVNNGFFEALAYAYDIRELEGFTLDRDTRPKQLYIVDKAVAEAYAH